MSDAIIQSIIVGSVAIISALIGGIVPHSIHKKMESTTSKRLKLEELYINIENWYNMAFSILCIDFLLVLNGHIDWNAYLDRINSKKVQCEHVKTEIILYLYFKNLERYFIDLQESVVEINRYIDEEMKTAYLAKKNFDILRGEYMKKIDKANQSFDKLKKMMQDIAKNLK